MSLPIRLLHLDDDPLDAEIVRDRLEADGLGCAITWVNDRPSFEATLAAGPWDIILCDYNLPGFDGLSALRLAQQTHPHTPVLMLSGSLSPEEGVECLRSGATDYLFKQRPERLPSAVRRALKEGQEEKARHCAEAALHESEERLGLAVRVAALGMWDVNLKTGVATWNDTLFQQLGHPATPDGTATMAMWQACVLPADLPQIMAELERARRTRTQFASEHRIMRAGHGETRWHSTAFSSEWRNR